MLRCRLRKGEYGVVDTTAKRRVADSVNAANAAVEPRSLADIGPAVVAIDRIVIGNRHRRDLGDIGD
jgi:hypothetical protein